MINFIHTVCSLLV